MKEGTRMKKQSAKPNVAPPASYKVPSLPTLAALGVITAAALATGCRQRISDGIIVEPCAPVEKGSETEPPLDGDIILPGEMPAIFETEGEIVVPSETEKAVPPEEKALPNVFIRGRIGEPRLP